MSFGARVNQQIGEAEFLYSLKGIWLYCFSDNMSNWRLMKAYWVNISPLCGLAFVAKHLSGLCILIGHLSLRLRRHASIVGQSLTSNLQARRRCYHSDMLLLRLKEKFARKKAPLKLRIERRRRLISLLKRYIPSIRFVKHLSFSTRNPSVMNTPVVYCFTL